MNSAGEREREIDNLGFIQRNGLRESEVMGQRRGCVSTGLREMPRCRINYDSCDI